jgi:peptidoglycan L-alanyl-D-glutamate endopeptidase CwlK
MPSFAIPSKLKLASLDVRLQTVLLEAIKYADFSIIWGHRGEKSQNDAYAKGTSQARWPDSPHNKLPSLAVDVAPWPGLYDRPAQDFYYLSGIIKGVATQLGIPVRCGCDWDGDGDTQNQRLHDLGHIELVP